MSCFSFRNLVLFFIALLITATTVIAVTAYSSATVTNPAQIKIVSTNQALLALSPGIDYGSMINVEVSESTGVLRLDLSFDFLTDQSYTYDELFKITNNSAETLTLSLESDLSYITDIAPVSNVLQPGQTTNVRAVFAINSNIEPGTKQGTIKVEADSN